MNPTNPLIAVKALGQHLWLDNLSRTHLAEGILGRLIADDGIDGVTSNPAIFHKAITGSPHYQADLQRLRASGIAPEARVEALVIPDVQAACDLLRPAHAASAGDAGYVSLEVAPALAHDAPATVAAAQRLAAAVGRDNLLIKVPATPAGLIAFEQLTALGLRVNVTLIFSLAQHAAVCDAYVRGALAWVGRGGDARRLRAVTSVFLSRVDTLVDRRLEALGTPAARALAGKSGVALAKRCYQQYLDRFHGPAFAGLAAAGVRPATPLWASTGTKNPAYSDVLYVEPLIGPETINTLPDATLAAFRDHGRVAPTLTEGMDAARAHIQALAALGIDLDDVGETLQVEGVRLFADAYDQLLAAVA
jgi:transaldolase